jgi:Fe-Mn family superoxide dismutase
MSSLAFRF